jgi:azurin
MHQYLIVSLALALAPLVAAPQTPSAEKPAPATQKPADKPAAGQAASKGARTVEIIGTDDMKYSVTSIAAKRGEQLRIRLVSKGTMPKIAMAHNVVVLQKDASQVKFVTAGATARATDFIPPDMKDQVIAATALAGPGETVEVTFKVPDVAGVYPFLCTFPGHFQAGMRGTLTVK